MARLELPNSRRVYVQMLGGKSRCSRAFTNTALPHKPPARISNVRMVLRKLGQRMRATVEEEVLALSNIRPFAL